jgi:glycogen operon protein
MTSADWSEPENRALGMLIHGEATDEVDERGHLIEGDTLLVLLNGGTRSRDFTLPQMEEDGAWKPLANTALRGPKKIKRSGVQLAARSLMLLYYKPAE